MSEPLVIDASAGVELILNSSTGVALRARMPKPAEEWAPEIYIAEVAAVLRCAKRSADSYRRRQASPSSACSGHSMLAVTTASQTRERMEPWLLDASST